MKALCTTFILFVSFMLTVIICIGGQYLSYYGPDWMMGTNFNNAKILGAGIVLSFFAALVFIWSSSMYIICDVIHGSKKKE